MASPAPSSKRKARSGRGYVLEEQVGFLLRQVNQRHTAIFAERINDNLTPTQFSAMVKLHELGPSSQNLLGRMTAMDAATIKGVIDRLTARGLTEVNPDPDDARLRVVSLTREGAGVIETALALAADITERTLDPLADEERRQFVALLKRLC